MGEVSCSCWIFWSHFKKVRSHSVQNGSFEIADANSGRARISPVSLRMAASDGSGNRGRLPNRRRGGCGVRTNLFGEEAQIEVLGPTAPVEVIDYHHHQAVTRSNRPRPLVKYWAKNWDKGPEHLQDACRHLDDQAGHKENSECPPPDAGHELAAAAQCGHSKSMLDDHHRRRQAPAGHQVNSRNDKSEKTENYQEVQQQVRPDYRGENNAD